MMRLHNDRAVPEGLTTRPHTDLYLSGDFILICLENKRKSISVFSHENQILLEKIPAPLIA